MPLIRWFTAHLTTEMLPDEFGEDLLSTDLADAEVVLISLSDGIDEAYLQVDGLDSGLSTPLEYLLHHDPGTGLSRTLPRLRAVLIINHLSVPEQLRGHGHAVRMIRELGTHFDYLTGPGVALAWPVPTQHNVLDPFTARAAAGRLEAVLTTVGMHRLAHTPIWCATLADLGRTEQAHPQPVPPQA